MVRGSRWDDREGRWGLISPTSTCSARALLPYSCWVQIPPLATNYYS